MRTAMRAALAAAAGLAFGCGRHVPLNPPPEDEIWLGPAEIAKAHLRIAEATEHDLSQPLVSGGRIAFQDQHVTSIFSPAEVKAIKREACRRIACSQHLHADRSQVRDRDVDDGRHGGGAEG